MPEPQSYWYSESHPSEEKAKQMVRILRNMADALEDNARIENNTGELSVDMWADAGKAWKSEPDSWAVFEAWVHFSAGPNAIVTEYPK